MRNRKNDVKIEHHIIKGIVSLLEDLTKDKYISAIVPGRIKPISGNYPKPVIEFKIRTATGIKCLAKSERATQEIFIISTNVENTINLIKSSKK